MSYTEEQLQIADQVIPRVTLANFTDDSNHKVMIDVRQHPELLASGTIEGAMHVPKGVIEFKLGNLDEVDEETSIYVFCAVGVRSALAGYNLHKIGYKKVYNLVGLSDIVEQGGKLIEFKSN